MTIFILTEGSSEIGFGHITRCSSLYQGFEKKELSPELIVNGDERIKNLLHDKKYEIFDWIEKKEELFSKIKEAEIVVIDSYLADSSFYQEISEMIKVPVYIDDNMRIDYPAGFVINPSLYGPELHYPAKTEVTYLLGKNYIFLRKEFLDVPDKHINDDIENILITLSGIVQADFIYEINNYIKDKFGIDTFTIDPASKRHSAGEMLDLMLRADICISGGGQTIYELARVGVPSVVICFAKNQIYNIKAWQEKGFLEYAGWYTENDILLKVEKAISRLMPKNERETRKNCGTGIIDGCGAERIIKEIYKKWS